MNTLNTGKLTTDDSDRLCETIRRGKCILVLGPDASGDPEDVTKPPLADQLARILANDRTDGTALSDDNFDLPLSSEIYLQSGNKDRYDLEQQTGKFIDRFAGKTTQLHRDLASLPFRLILKTTHDSFIETALREQPAGKDPGSAHYNFKTGPGQSLVLPDDQEKPLVYGVFGDRADPESMVLTESDILDFLVKVARGSSTLPAQLSAYLAEPDKAFLFLGFGFHRWYSRMLLHLLKQTRRGTRSIALERDDVYEKADWPETALFFDSSFAISFHSQSWPDFATRLRTRFGESTPSSSNRPAAVSLLDAPTVFLCHDGDDAAPAARLEKQLKARGIDTWLDKQRLRGGDNWDRRIKKVIADQHQVNYLLVLESPRLLSRPDGYVFLEIEEALERQRQTRRGFTFLIPTTLETCPGLQELNHLHRTNATTPEGVDRLCQDILSDWRKRSELKAARAAE